MLTLCFFLALSVQGQHVSRLHRGVCGRVLTCSPKYVVFLIGLWCDIAFAKGGEIQKGDRGIEKGGKTKRLIG